MPRNGSGQASPPPGTTATPNTTIQSTPYNAVIADLYALQNEQRPITAGGTGAGSAAGARAALGIDGVTDAFSPATATVPAALALAEATDNGTNQVSLRAPDDLDADYEITMPAKSGTVALEGASAGKLDVRRNRIVNGDMRQDQEWNGAAGTTNGRYGRDQWATFFNSSAATITTQGVASVTPAGSPNRYRVTITAADTALAAGEFLSITQNLEGSNVADFQYGGSAAKAAVLRFGFKGPAGTYGVALHNGAANRSFVAMFTIEAGQANTDTVQTIAIPGDESGTWLTADGVIGITLDIVLAAGTTFRGAEGWQAGNILATSAISNGMGTTGAVFELFDVGLRLDPDATGVYGQYEVGEVNAVYRSERYVPYINQPLGLTLNANLLYSQGHVTLPVVAAKTPTLLSGTYSVNTGAAGTVGLVAGVTRYGVGFNNNAGNNWSSNALVSVVALLNARLS